VGALETLLGSIRLPECLISSARVFGLVPQSITNELPEVT